MAEQRRETWPQQADAPTLTARAAAKPTAGDAIDVLCVGPRSIASRIRRGLREQRILATLASGAEAAREELAARRRDLVIVAAEGAGTAALPLLRELADAGHGVVLACENPTLDAAIAAMRDGALDAIGVGQFENDPAAAGARLIDAAGRAAQRHDRDARERRLRCLCRTLDQQRRELSGQVASLCDDLVRAYADMGEQLQRLGDRHEFQAIIRHELEVEELLRVVLEYLLARAGAMNAAVFLPDGSEEWTLGAYVNHDVPAELAETTLDHLAGVVAPRFEGDRGVTLLEDDQDLYAAIGEDADWLEGQTAAVFTSWNDNECLAVTILFRDASRPFDSAVLDVLPIVAEGFGRQLARVIRVHHRHLPEDQWGGPWGPSLGGDDYGLAA